METIFTGAFSHPDAEATPWRVTDQGLREAELYWLTTVRADGRPHVTPVVGLWLGTTFYLTTGDGEQKARNLQHHDGVAVTTGQNTWNSGLDVVVEGSASLRRDHDELDRVTAAYAEKYGDDWAFHREGDRLSEGEGHAADLWGVETAKVIAFAKSPHAQTTYRF